MTIDDGATASINARPARSIVALSVAVLITSDFESSATDLDGQSLISLAGIVVIDIAPEVQSQGTERITSFAADPTPGSLDDFVQRALAFDSRRDPRLLRHSLRHNLRQLPNKTWTWKYDPRRITPEHFANIMRCLEQLRDHVRAITCPVLVVRGADSDVLSDEQAADFAAALPNGRWAKVQAAGHNVQSDNPRELIGVLIDFLTDIDHRCP